MSSLNLLNLLQCIVKGGSNTRFGDCVTTPDILDYALLVPRAYRFPYAATASQEALEDAFIDLVKNDNPSQRGYLIGRFENVELAGEARQQETAAGSGSKRETRGAKIGYKMTIWNGGMEYQEAVYSFHGQQNSHDVIFFDKQGWPISTYATVSNQKALAGLSLADIAVSEYIMPTGSTGGSFTIEFQLSDSNQLNKRRAVIQTEFDTYEALQGLFNVELEGTSPATNVINITGRVGKVDMKGTYGADLEQVGAYVVKNKDANNANYGNIITVASIAPTATGYALTLAPPTGTGADADNPGPGKNVSVEFAANSVLAGLTTPVLDLESNIEIVTLHA